jgi:hypothetical protein
LACLRWWALHWSSSLSSFTPRAERCPPLTTAATRTQLLACVRLVRVERSEPAHSRVRVFVCARTCAPPWPLCSDCARLALLPPAPTRASRMKQSAFFPALSVAASRPPP